MIRTLQTEPVLRTSDAHGQGHFGAPRGSRVHMGIDFAVLPDSWVLAPRAGVISKLGYPYAQHTHIRYVELTEFTQGDRLRFFYVYPMGVAKGRVLEVGERLGFVQDLEDLYPGITPHVHFEVKTETGKFLKPEEYLNGYREEVPA